MAEPISQPTCTVVVCTRDRPGELARCLAALGRVDYPHFTALVVDNAPSDGRTRVVAERFGVDYAVAPVAGLSRARNLGARLATSEVVAYLDDDAVPAPGWLAALCGEFAVPQVAAVVGRTFTAVATDADGKLTSLGGVLGGTERRVVTRSTDLWFELTNFGGVGAGMNMAFRRSALLSSGAFDVRLGRGAGIPAGEEHLAFFALVELGFEVAYNPRAEVIHCVPADPAERLRRRRLDAVAAGAYLALLWFEHPQHRRRLARYVLQYLRGDRRMWRHVVYDGSFDGLPRAAWLFPARMRGLLAYVRVRGRGHESGLMPTPVAASVAATSAPAQTTTRVDAGSHPFRGLELCQGPCDASSRIASGPHR